MSGISPHEVIETPHGPMMRRNTADTLPSMRSLNFAADLEGPPSSYADDEPTWPKGWRPYACLFGGFLLMFNSWGIVNTYGTFASYYMQHLLPGRDIMLLNLVGSTQSFVVLALSAIVGRFLDAGHSRALICTGTVLLAIGSFMLSLANGDGSYNSGNYGLIWLTQGFISGLGMACFFVSSSQGMSESSKDVSRYILTLRQSLPLGLRKRRVWLLESLHPAPVSVVWFTPS